MVKLLAVFILVSGAMAFAVPASPQACGILNGGTSGGLGVDPGYTADLTGQANEGCNVLITFNSNGSITTTSPNANGFYDGPAGGDDNTVGIINNTSAPITSLMFSSVSQDIFAFDGDGACGGYTFDAAGPNCGTPTDPSGYAPQGITFSPATNFSGTVNFNTAIAPGGSAWFSLEGPVALDLTVGSGTPEPATFGLIGMGLTGLYFVRRRAAK